MKKILISLAVSSLLLLASGHEKGHWGYGKENGPDSWGKIYHQCALGANQSPVDINRTIEAKLPRPKVFYAGNAQSVINNGHTIQVSVIGINSFTIDGKKFLLKQFHFHTPSENLIAGHSFPMEAHFVHKSDDGEYLVVALMFKEGRENPALEKILHVLDPKVGKEVKLQEMFNPGDLFPRKLDYYRYNGSFTTPPCTEGVRWIVLKYPVEASKAQIQRFHAIMGDNNRPVQPLRARVILK